MKVAGRTIDCVKMKDAIQGRLVERRKTMSAGRFVADVEESLARSQSPVAVFWRGIHSVQGLKSRDSVTAGR
jgi:hypothetical protein